ncbi:uncharacterized protein LOC108671170 [Hyalella azteca]|uniref:ubiquitinyl hydrolase 1 n=1 Tax=Hyalella azteca TaxID=294128 RepID=A0A8B7NKH2_HYAAZ|nr:uncharacterized protein LOC108671170 [Hyalella azteca]
MDEHEKQAFKDTAVISDTDCAGMEDSDELDSSNDGAGHIKLNSSIDADFGYQPPTPIQNSPEDHLSPSSMTSCDLERPSPLEGSPCMDCSDDGGSDDIRGSVATAAITSSWVSSGGGCYGAYSDDSSSHPGLGYVGSSQLQNSPCGSPPANASIATSFLGPLMLPGTSEKTQGSQSEGSVLGDSNIFGVTPACDMQDFADVGGSDSGKAKTDATAEEGGQGSSGLVYGPVMPWQRFNTVPIEDASNCDVEGSCIAGECGLQNLGNTCFMAAGLQCLLNTPPFVEYFFCHPHDSEEGSLVAGFSELVHKVWSGRFSSTRPVAFKQAFGNHWRDFQDYRQHDCQEFVTLLLEGLRKQMSLKLPAKLNNDDDILCCSKTSPAAPLQEADGLFSTHWPTGAESFSEDSKDSDIQRPGGGLASEPTADSEAVILPSNECCMEMDTGEDLASLLLPSPSLPASPPSPRVVIKHPDEQSRGSGESQEDGCEDSGATSPKSSVSSSSVDSHLINMRLQPIPEEVLLHAASSSLLRERQAVPELTGTSRLKQRRLQGLSHSSTSSGFNGAVSLERISNDERDPRLNEDEDSRMEEDFDEFEGRGSYRDNINSSADADSTFPQSDLVTSAHSSKKQASHRVVSFNPCSPSGMLVSSSSDSAEAIVSKSDAPHSSNELINNNSTVAAKLPLPLPDVLQNTIASNETNVMIGMDTSPDVSSSLDTYCSNVNVLDIMKESKTSNVNVLVTENQPNNELLFDSEKYAKCDKAKLKESLDNLGHDVGDTALKDNNLMSLSRKIMVQENLQGKKGKRSNCLLEPNSSVEGILNNLKENSDIISHKKIRLEEKNIQLELERSNHVQDSLSSSSSTSDVGQSSSSSSSSTSGAPPSPKPQECISNIARVAAAAAAADAVQAGSSSSIIERNADRDLRLAEESWKNFIGEGEGSVLMDTFYGQFKSCLVCSVCGHSSVKFDPFGTLSVPLPHANETQIVVTYVSYDKSPALRCLVTLNKMSDVRDLKAAVVQLLTQDFSRRNAAARPATASSSSSSTGCTASYEDIPGQCIDEDGVAENNLSGVDNNELQDCKMEENEGMSMDDVCFTGNKNVNNDNDDQKEIKRDGLRTSQKNKKRKSSLCKPPEVSQLIVAELLDNHIARILEDTLMTKYVNKTSRSVYAYHLLTSSPPSPYHLPCSPPPVPPNPSTKYKTRISPTLAREESVAMTDLSPGLKGGSKICNPLLADQNQSSPTSPSSCPLRHSPVSSNVPLSQSPEPRLTSHSNQTSALKSCLASSSSKTFSKPFSKLLPGLNVHSGGIDGGNARCSYSDPSKSEKPFYVHPVATNATPGGVIGGAGGSTTTPPSGYPPASASLSFNDAPSSSSRDVAEECRPAEVSEEGSEWKTCNICLEEMCQTELKTHDHCYDCLLCETCIDMSVKHHGTESDSGGSLPCPVCQTSLTRDSLIPVARRPANKPKPRLLRVGVVFRLDAENADNNKRQTSLLGHPRLLLLPSTLPLGDLWSALQHCIPPGADCQLLLVDGRGYNCSRCLFVSHCRGCDVVKSSGARAGSGSGDVQTVRLQAGDTICVRFTRLTAMQRYNLSATKEHPSLALRRQESPLTLYDCLRTFTRSEKLESSESWYCPECECKQPATKTVSIWKCPPYLILHLERFLFHGTSSSKLDDKVIFPVENLDMREYFGGRCSGPQLYNLYGVVCHVGVVQAGHYTSLVRSPVSGQWRHFNDECVTARKPSEDEYSSAYLLFYHRNDLPFRLHLPRVFSFLPNRDCEATTTAGSVAEGSPIIDGRCGPSSPVIDITDHDNNPTFDDPTFSDPTFDAVCADAEQATGDQDVSNLETFPTGDNEAKNFPVSQVAGASAADKGFSSSNAEFDESPSKRKKLLLPTTRRMSTDGYVEDSCITKNSFTDKGSTVPQSSLATSVKPLPHSSTLDSFSLGSNFIDASVISSSTRSSSSVRAVDLPSSTADGSSSTADGATSSTSMTSALGSRASSTLDVVGASSSSSSKAFVACVSQSSDAPQYSSRDAGSECTSSEQVEGVSSSSSSSRHYGRDAGQHNVSNSADLCTQSNNLDFEPEESNLH